MKKLSIFVFWICILLTVLLGCTASRGMSIRERILNAAWHQKETKKDKAISSLEQTFNLWIGHHISGVIRRMGPATQITDDQAGGQIYIWVQHHQKTVRQPYTINPPKQETPICKKTITSGEMRWNPLFNRLEYESETKTTYPEKSFSDRLLEMQTRTKYRKETVTTTGRMMLYTRADGTIYHWLIITPNNHYSYNNRRNAKKDVHHYNNQSLSEEEKGQYPDDIRKYDMTIYLFPNDVNAYFNRGIAKYKLGLTHEAEQDLRTALRLATQQDKVNLKNRIEKSLRALQ